jgi:hypothetical protein
MRTLIVGVFVSAALAAGVMWLAPSGGSEAGAGSVDYAGVDLFGFDNTCNSLGTTDTVRSNVPLNQPFTIDIIVKGVPEGAGTADGGGIYGTGFEFIFDESLLRVTGASGGANNVLQLCASPSVPFEFNDTLPDTDGSFRFDSVDLSPNEESGDGRLASLTLECIAQGTASLDFTDTSTGGNDTIAVTGDSGGVLYTVATEGTGQIGCNTDLGVTPPPTPTPCTTNCPTASPTPTAPPGTERLWPDVNCDESIDPVDGLGVLRHDAGLSVNQEPGCPAVGEAVTVDGTERQWGDGNCDGEVNPVDGLAILRFDAGLSVNQQAGCPTMGEPVIVS